MNDLIKIPGGEITIAEAEAIKSKTGYDIVAIPEHAEQFCKIVAAVEKIKNVPDYYKKIKVDKIQRIIESDQLLTIKNLNGFYGHAKTQAQLAIAITDLCNFFNINKNMNVEQIADTVNFIIDTYPINCLTLADVKLCFSWIKSGKYGQIYDRMDGGVILTALHKYFEQRCEIAEEQFYNQHCNTKGAGNFGDKRAADDSSSFMDKYKIWKLNNLK